EPDAPVRMTAQRLRRFLRAVPVPLHDLWSRDAQLAGIAALELLRSAFEIDDLDGCVGQRQPDTPGLTPCKLRRAMRGRGSFRQAVSLVQGSSDATFEFFNHLHRTWCAARVEGLHLLQSEFPDTRV